MKKDGSVNFFYNKIFRHCIFLIVCTPKGIWKFMVMYIAVDRNFYKTRLMIEH